jgi:hypothetical protein
LLNSKGFPLSLGGFVKKQCAKFLDIPSGLMGDLLSLFVKGF